MREMPVLRRVSLSLSGRGTAGSAMTRWKGVCGVSYVFLTLAPRRSLERSFWQG